MKRLVKIFQRKYNWIGIIFIILLAGLAMITPRLYPQDIPGSPQYFRRVGKYTDLIPRPPSEKAVLGTLAGQYDVLYTMLWGLRQAFQFGLSVTLITAVFGILFGATSGYVGGLFNNVLMRIADAFLTFPLLPAIFFMRQIILVVVEASGNFFSAPQNQWFITEPLTSLQKFLFQADPVMWSLVLLSWMPYARLVNASVLRLRNVEYVVAAQSLGAGHWRIILRHLLPNIISPEIILATRDVGGMVILQATFTFIGLGGNSPWGQLLAGSRDWVIGLGGNPLTYWWTYIPTTLLLIIFSISWNLIGDTINDWLNPRKLA